MAKERTGKHLVIVESPAKAKTINKYLGDGFIVKASMGHVRDLPKGNGAIDMETFQPKYEIIKERGKEKLVSELRKLAKDAPDVYLATDLDREGEAIAWHLQQALGLPDDRVKRVIFNAITQTEIQKAFAKPNAIDIDRVNAQQARRILDRIVGYEISPVLWRKVARGLSAGRVQSVAVRLIVDREREIEAFMPSEYWRIGGIFTTAMAEAAGLADAWHTFAAGTEEFERTKVERDKWLADHGCFAAELTEFAGAKFEPDNRDQARRIAEALGYVVTAEHPATNDKAKGPERNTIRYEGRITAAPKFAVRNIEKKRSTSRPPAPFITSTLQQAASTRLSFGAQRAMRLAQTLYEAGHITYMRTDSTHLSGDALNMARSFIRSEFGDRYVPEKPNFFSSSNKSAQEAHEAIRPTDANFIPTNADAKIGGDEARMYRLIWTRFVACQMPPAEFDQTAVNIAAATPLGEATFRATGRKLVFDGFMRVAGVSSEDQLLPDLAEGTPVAPVDVQPSQHFTQPPARYNEASLVKELESKGIGRPSTYASIIQTIQDRKYVAQRERRLFPTMLGRVVTEKLMQGFPQILDVGFTADMEAKLDQVEENHLDWVKLLRDFYGPFKGDVKNALEILTHAGGAASPYFDDAGVPMVYRISANGFFLASSDPDKKVTKPVDEFGVPVMREESGFLCPLCNRPMLKRGGRFGDFLSCTGYSEKTAEGTPLCSLIVPLDKAGAPQPPKAAPIKTEVMCDKDKAPMLLRNSKRGPFLGCSSFPKCRGTKMVKKLPPEQIKYIESLLPELRQRTQRSYELAAKITGKPVEAFGRLPDLTIATVPDEKPKRPPARGKRKPTAAAAAT
ncbi:MAG TPA: type I DNA topoisomerase [Tepidisphaeraceae bacterium]|jgi:DNA topoisomerase-1